jgi:glutamate synthase domain-containing protein 2
LTGKMTIEWGTQRLINLFNAWSIGLKKILKRFGMKKISELRGRTDLLIHLDFIKSHDTK